MGALAFGHTPEAPIAERPLLRWEDLENTAYLEAIQKLDTNVPLTAAEEEAAFVFGAGTSAGGARPKFAIHRDGAIWLELAAQYAYTGSYPRFSRELARWTITGDQDRRQLFRRIAFNSLISSTDDHERNHALVAEGAHFRLAPAFDLVPRLGNTQKRYLALAIGDFGAIAVRENLLSSAPIFQLTRAVANEVIDEVQHIVRTRWCATLAARDVSTADIERIAGCFDPPSFEAPAPEQALL
jgi:hypothetical protein